MAQLPRSTLVGYAILAVVVLVVGGRWLAAQGKADAATASSAVAASGGSSAGSGTGIQVAATPPSAATVDVAGAVRRPGVYRLTGTPRVRDALRRAGGASTAGDTTAVNLAAKLVDGQQIVVPRRATSACVPAAAAPASAASSGAASAAPASGPVSLGAATIEQLDGLPGVGPATAQKIIDWRSQHGGFASVDDLGQVPGIGPKKLEALRAQVQP